jgi:hypothetical protein
VFFGTLRSMGVSMGTNYIYEWKPSGEGGKVSVTEPIPEKKRKPIEEDSEFWAEWSEQAKKWTPEDIEEAKKTSNRIRVGDLYGECIVLRGWEEDIDQAIYVERDTPIYHGDLIITRNKGGVILSYSDMSSFHVEEGSSVIIDDNVINSTITIEKAEVMMPDYYSFSDFVYSVHFEY